MNTTPHVSDVLCTFCRSLFWTPNWKQTRESLEPFIYIYLITWSLVHRKSLWLRWNYVSHLQFQRNCRLQSQVPGENTFLSVKNLHRANTYRVTHCLFRLNSSIRNPEVPYVVSLLCRQLSQRKTPHSLQPALRLQFTETMTCDKNKTLYLVAMIYCHLLSHLQQTGGNGTAYQSTRSWLHPPLRAALRHLSSSGTTAPPGNQPAAERD